MPMTDDETWKLVCPHEDCPGLKSHEADKDCGEHEDWMT